jgi:quercetin dioxygenase-like cupin family protein
MRIGGERCLPNTRNRMSNGLMRTRPLILGLALAGFAVAGPVEKVKNEKVVSVEYTLKPGESAPLSHRPSITVYFDDALLELKAPNGATAQTKVKRADTAFLPEAMGEVKNTGSSPLKFVRTEFLTEGSSEKWGNTGLAPNYKLLFENRYARVYDIRIEAGTREPQHTHHARVVVCLSGAILKHVMPDGREEPSTLNTGDVVWRPGSTHIGQNLGTTNLWVIAIEPK